MTLKDSTDNYSRFDITTKEESAYGVSLATTTVSRSWAQRAPRTPAITYDGRVNVCGLTISGNQITISGVGGYIVMVVGYKS